MTEAAGKKLISLVVPAYNEEESIDELVARLQAVFDENPAYDFEAVVVDNGSWDGTYDKLVKAHKQDPRFKVLQLARNFRTDGGITAGLNYINGDAAVIIAADLQDPPEMITDFLEKWEEGYDNVYGIVTKRHGSSPMRKMNSRLFYWLINKMTGGVFPKNVSDFRLVDRAVYETINDMRERNRFMRGMFFWAGFKSVGIKHERPARFAGESKAHTLKVLELALKGIFAYSYLPLRFITITGLFVSLLSFLILAGIVIRVVFWGVPFPGFGSIMAVMLLMFGFLFTMLGVVSEYVGLIYDEVKKRPNFIVRNKIGL